MSISNRLVQITDLHLCESPGDLLEAGINTDHRLAQGLELVQRLRPDWIVATGDLAQDPREGTYLRLRSAFAQLEAPVYPLPGNHDEPEMMGRMLGDDGGRLTKRVVNGNWQLLLLDSTSRDHPLKGNMAYGELEWLDQTLAGTASYHSLICLHHHPLPVGSSWMDRIALDNSDEFLDCLDRHSQVRGVAFGHVHQEFQAERNGVRFFGTPSTAIQFVPGSAHLAIDNLPPAVRYFDLHADGLIQSAVEYVTEHSPRI
jgi:3',5'-cyclic-AMP phosphodiesterase